MFSFFSYSSYWSKSSSYTRNRYDESRDDDRHDRDDDRRCCGSYDWYGSKQFYKLEDDPTGLTDVYDAADPDVIALWPEMIDWADEVESYWPHLGPPWYEGP